MSYFVENCDVAVIGAGHAGIEAALAAARLGLKTILFTINLDAVSGATITSNAFIEAAKAALTAAGLNPDDYMTKVAAAAAGESMNQYIIGATEQRINRKSPQNAAEARGDSNTILAPDALKIAQEAAQRAGEDVPAFVSRAVTNQDQRDKVAMSLRVDTKKAPEESGT